MKITLVAFGFALFSQYVSASPIVDDSLVTFAKRDGLHKRATLSDVATLGYATLNGGTKGGLGGPTVIVTTVADLTAAVADDVPRVVVIKGNLVGTGAILIGSNKSVVGATPTTSLTGVGLRVLSKNNVIIRNLKISKVLADADAIGVQLANNVWIDHVELFNDQDHDKDYYDGLIDITHGCKYISVTYSYLHDHWKGSLVGHSDNNGAEDKPMLVSYAYLYFLNIYSRTPSFRFGTGHIWNSYFENIHDGVHTRDAAQLLVENSVFVLVDKPIFSSDGGFAVARGNDYGTAKVGNSAPVGSLTSVPYQYTLTATTATKAYVVANAGPKFTFA